VQCGAEARREGGEAGCGGCRGIAQCGEKENGKEEEVTLIIFFIELKTKAKPKHRCYFFPTFRPIQPLLCCERLQQFILARTCNLVLLCGNFAGAFLFDFFTRNVE